jgi:ABC-type nickel/cobalt efflux system permease component RcnA
MLILPPGHAQRLRERRAFSVRERWMVGGVLGMLAALAVVLVISFSTAGRQSANGCINVALSYSTGGAQIFRCGAGARALCEQVDRPGGLSGVTGRAVAVQCRKAGLPVG